MLNLGEMRVHLSVFFLFFKASAGKATLLLLLLFVMPRGLQGFSSPTRA